MRVRLNVFLLCLLGTTSGLLPEGRAQVQCAERLNFTPVTQANQIGWDKFPTFTLPFPVVYGGPRFADTQASPLKHGFSHLINVKNNEYGSLVQKGQWGVIYYGFATGLNQPWETLESPWGNNLTAYRAKWEQWLLEISGGQKNAAGQYIFPASRLTLDLERIRETDSRILLLKQETSVPTQYRQLSDANFIVAYKNAIRNLYAEGMRYIRQRADLTGVTVSSYADTPILNTYINVTGFSWTDWSTNLNRVNYLVKDSTGQAVGGPYYSQLDALSPSAYYFYDYPNPFASDYLPYLLFQVEVNRAWSNKPVVPLVWLRYHNSSNFYPNFVQPFMAEATAIFPVFSGAAGLWLWEEPNLENTRTDVYAAYEHFTHGLYRLSQFTDMFQGSYERVIETPARDLMDKQLPVWRGIVKGNQILIAAQNSYASEGQVTTVTVRYKDWARNIELTGREVFLCKFDMSAVTANEPVAPIVQVFPNPASTVLTVSMTQPTAEAVELALLNISGQVVVKKSTSGTREDMSIAHLPAGTYFLRVRHKAGAHTQQVIISR
jgi:hypothetical protein